MRCISVPAPEEWNDARGPDLLRWLTDADLRFSGIGEAYASPTGSLVGALSHDHWVIFRGLQVIQVVPDEVHSAWHYRLMEQPRQRGSVWQIIDSDWLKSFKPTHLSEHKHFIIRFYDDVIEVICQELIFGRNPFDLAEAIAANPGLAYAYLQLAISLEKDGKHEDAISNFEAYLRLSPNDPSAEYARRCILMLRSK